MAALARHGSSILLHKHDDASTGSLTLSITPYFENFLMLPSRRCIRTAPIALRLARARDGLAIATRRPLHVMSVRCDDEKEQGKGRERGEEGGQSAAKGGKKAGSKRATLALDGLPLDRTAPSLLPDVAAEGAEKKPRKKRASKTASLSLDDLPQGLVSSPALSELPSQDETPQYPTVVLQAKRNMQKFDNCVLLTRVGGFYELYFEHADEYGPLLNLKVAIKKTNAGPVAMAGFPFFQLERFLKVLVMDLNKYVAIAEEFPNDAAGKVKPGGLLHDRRVARVVTPGTLIDEGFLEGGSDNFVLALHIDSETSLSSQHIKDSKSIGLAWLDLSTGIFFTQQTTTEALSSALSRINPKEIVLDTSLKSQESKLPPMLTEERHITTYCQTPHLPITSWNTLLASPLSNTTASTFTPEEVRAGNLLLEYVADRIQGSDLKLQAPVRHFETEVLSIDRATLRGLEIKENFRDGTLTGTLLHSLKRTLTSGGGRLLKTWLSAPSTNIAIINGRLDVVERLRDQEGLRERLINLLKRCHDSQRLVQKFALGRGSADDLLDLSATIYASQEVVNALQSAVGEASSYHTQIEARDPLMGLLLRIHLDEPLKLAKRIEKAISVEALQYQHEIEDSVASDAMALAESVAASQGTIDDLNAVKEGRGKKKPGNSTSLRDHYGEDRQIWIMKRDASPALQNAHDYLESLEQKKEALQKQLTEQFEAQCLTLKWTPGLGHIVHMKGKHNAHSQNVLSSSKSTRSIQTPSWTELGLQMDAARTAIRAEETKLFSTLRALVIKYLVPLRRTAAVLDELDVFSSFASLAAEQELTRPILNITTTTTIISGHHPTVSPSLRTQGRSFITNDLSLSSTTPHILTGPNMGGKSTFLRQTALLAILAQIGSFVPAKYFEAGIVDRLFARIGSADDLYRDQSTFMLEMLEVSNILRQATGRTLVIMDEVGRGTSPISGEAVSFATLDHLTKVNKCRTLFATHFHSLGDMARKEGMEIEEWCTGIEEDRDGFRYLYKLRRGVNKESHALKVAKLAGMPESAIALAKGIIERDEK